MKILSLFSGVGGFDLGLEAAGMETVFQCEWDKHATSVLKHRWPDVPKWGDISTLTGKHVLEHAPVIDVVAWGSPCQDLSVAGKRAGLSGAKSGLFHEGIRVIKEIQEETNGQYPRISIWENVVGALSSNKGADFGVIIDAMAEAGALAIEWAVLDAQHFGVPQRRRRVFVVAIFDPVLAGRCPDPLLPVSESLPGHLAKGKQKRKSAATKIATSIGADGQWAAGTSPDGDFLTTSITSKWSKGSGGPSGSEYYNMVVENGILGSDIVGSLNTSDAKMISSPYVNENKSAARTATESTGIGSRMRGFGDYVNDDTASAIKARDYKDATDLVTEDQPILIDRAAFNQGENALYEPYIGDDPISPSLVAKGPHAVATHEPILMRQREGKPGGGKGPLLSVDKSLTLAGSNDQTLFSSEPKMTVRRLTPLECERLMGWPDGHTRYKADGTEQSDTQRYKQCGNGIASPVAAWIGKHVMGI